MSAWSKRFTATLHIELTLWNETDKRCTPKE
jgi:hypothetical protein